MANDPSRRKQVADLQGGNGQLQPAANPSVDSYARAGSVEVGRPLNTNPLLKLADALAPIQAELAAYGTQKIKQYVSNEEATGAQQVFDLGRDKVNGMIKSGEIPAGASPYAARGFQRAALKQAGEEYFNQAYADFNGEPGAAARESNDPADMRKFLDTSYNKFAKEWLNGGNLNSLDVHEVLHPAIEQANAHLMKAHADYRVKRIEQDYENSVSAQSGHILDEEVGKLTPTSSDEERADAYRRAGTRMMDLLENKDTGYVTNTGQAKKGNDLLLDALTTKAMQTGNRAYLAVQEHLQTTKVLPNGKSQILSIGNTKDAQAKILAAEEHITREAIQAEHFKHWKDGLDYEALSREHTKQGWAKEEEKWNRDKAQLATGLAHKDTMDILTRRMYQALRAPSAVEKMKAVNGVLRVAEEVVPQEVGGLQGIVDAATQRSTHTSDDAATLGTFRLQMATDPLSFDPARFRQAAMDKLIGTNTMSALFDDLERQRNNAGHPFVKQPVFTELLHNVSRGVMRSPEDEFSAEGQARATDAIGAFRGKAAAWIEKNPKGGIDEFTDYMRDQVKPILESSIQDYGKDQQKARGKVEAEGQAIVENTQKLVKQRDQIVAERKAKADAEQKVKDDRDAFNRDFQPTGEKTKEGKVVLRNAKGEISTEGLITIKDQPEINHGGITNIPTIFGGKKVSDAEAIEIMSKNKGIDPDNGKKAKRWYSVSDAQIAARESTARDVKAFTPKAEKPTEQPQRKVGPVEQAKLGSLMTTTQRNDILSLRDRVLSAGIHEKQPTQEALRNKVLETLQPIYDKAGASPWELADGVNEFVTRLLAKQQQR